MGAVGCVVNCVGSECERLEGSLGADSHNYILGEMNPSVFLSLFPL